MAKLKRSLYTAFQEVAKQRDQARLDLVHAQEIIALLETEIEALNFHVDEASTKLLHHHGLTKSQIVNPPGDRPLPHWIQGLWIADPDTTGPLQEAEDEWEKPDGNPQKALVLATKMIKGVLTPSERIAPTLLVAAILLKSGMYEHACANANEALRLCGTDFKYKRFAGIAHYLRGCVFLEIESFYQAYWDFSLAIGTEGYHDKAKYWRDYTEDRIRNQEVSHKGLAKKTGKQRESLGSTTRSRDKNALKLPSEKPIDLGDSDTE